MSASSRRGLSGSSNRSVDPYAEIDPVIDACVQANGSVLKREWAGRSHRFFYLPGDPPFECFQIAVEAPRDGKIVVSAWAVDTNDDTETDMEEHWEGDVPTLSDMLVVAVRHIDQWKRRVRTKPDPLSPW